MIFHKLIFIDDDVSNNVLNKIIAKRAVGTFETLTFDNPEVAVSYLAENYPVGSEQGAIVFLDINMPVLNGWMVLDKLQEIYGESPLPMVIYMLSSSIDARDRIRAAEHPLVKDYISKPLEIELLKSVVSGLATS